MDDGLEIRSGGAIAVDTETLRHAAAQFEAARVGLDDLSLRLSRARSVLFAQRHVAGDAESAAALLYTRLADAQREADEIVSRLRAAAAVYELVELNIAYDNALLAGDAGALARIDAERDRIMTADPEAMALARGFQFDRAVMWPSELVRQATEFGYLAGHEAGSRAAVYGGTALGLTTLALAATTGLTGAGRIGRDDRLTGGPAAVTVFRVAPGTAAGAAGAAGPAGLAGTARGIAPSSLAGAAQRIPGSDGSSSRVRVEKYTMPDGSRQFAVYVAGMQSGAVGGGDAWDNLSNGELFAGRESASYTATALALADAGAQPGDAVHAFGFSQGAMITSHLAVEGGYDVRTLVSYGSPVEADVGPGTLVVGIRHRDDPVTALAGGGHMTPVGATGGFTVERAFDPATRLDDATLPAHRLDAYVETAALADASGDPRLGGVQRVFQELGGAASVEVTEYGAVRGAPGHLTASSGGG